MQDLKTFLNNIHPVSLAGWDAIMRLSRPRQLKKDDYYIREGEYASDFAFINSGLVRAFYTTAAGRSYTKHFFTNPGIIGGYASLITGKPALFSQQAITDCELINLNYPDFLQLYNHHPELERLGRKFAENYFAENEQKEIDLVLKNATTRYIELRQRLPGIEQLVAQYHIASYLGVTATQLSRIRKELASA